jgi:hypothetical protein
MHFSGGLHPVTETNDGGRMKIGAMPDSVKATHHYIIMRLLEIECWLAAWI